LFLKYSILQIILPPGNNIERKGQRKRGRRRKREIFLSFELKYHSSE
jgi:hypothetical protein